MGSADCSHDVQTSINLQSSNHREMEPQHSSESARASNTFNLEQLKLDLKSFPKPNLKSVQADSGFLDVHDPAIPPQVPEKDRDLSLLPDTSFIEGPSVIRDDSYDMSAAPVQAMSSKEKFRSNPVAALEYARSRNAEKYQKDITLATADPSTVRKCAIADYCTYRELSTLLTYSLSGSLLRLFALLASPKTKTCYI